jgi:transcription initiation factor IIE alpha subunit
MQFLFGRLSMSKQLRIHLLLLLEEHSRTGSPAYKQDTDLAHATGAALDEIRRQLDILEAQGLITSANARDGHTARIKPEGSLAVERLEEAETPEEKRSIGFGAEK